MKKRSSKYGLSHVPDGWVRMGMQLTIFKAADEKMMDKYILRMILRDYYIVYSKQRKFKGKQWLQYHFYCRPQDEIQITRLMGIYTQAIFGYVTKDYIINATHTVPANFPKCIRVKHQ